MSPSMSNTADSPASSCANGKKSVDFPEPDAPVTTSNGSVGAGSRRPHSGHTAKPGAGAIGVGVGHDSQKCIELQLARSRRSLPTSSAQDARSSVGGLPLFWDTVPRSP
jgi:hypothetical protein